MGTFGNYIIEIIIPDKWNTESSFLKTRDKSSELWKSFLILIIFFTLFL